MAARQVEDGVLGAHAVITHVRVLVYELLLLHAESVNHLSHALGSLWLDDSRGDFVFLAAFVQIFKRATIVVDRLSLERAGSLG